MLRQAQEAHYCARDLWRPLSLGLPRPPPPGGRGIWDPSWGILQTGKPSAGGGQPRAWCPGPHLVSDVFPNLACPQPTPAHNMTWRALGATPGPCPHDSGLSPRFSLQVARDEVSWLTQNFDPQHARVLQTELTFLLNKGSIRDFKQGDCQAGVYSIYFFGSQMWWGLTPHSPISGVERIPPPPVWNVV